jgi:spore maturation protein SpmB
MNIAANMLGLGNAATPLGLRAMNDLEKLNPQPGTATNAMCTFLAINTSSVQLIPATAIAILAAKGAANPSAIVGTSLLATSCAAIAGVTAAKLLEKLRIFARGLEANLRMDPGVLADEAPAPVAEPALLPPHAPAGWGKAALIVFLLAAAVLFVRLAFFGDAGETDGTRHPGSFLRVISAISLLAVPFTLAFFPLYAAVRGIKVYEEFVEGAKEGFQVSLRIIPFLVAMLAAVYMFRGSGGLDLLTNALRPALAWIGFPPELLPLTLLRPLSGSGALALFSDLITHNNPDGLIARTAGTIMGSTETTFYVLAVYFGSVAVRRTRHAVAAGLTADLTGVIVSVAICRLMFS